MRPTFLFAVWAACLLAGAGCAHPQQATRAPGEGRDPGNLQVVPLAAAPAPEGETAPAEPTAALTQEPLLQSDPKPSSDPLNTATADAAGAPVVPPDPPSESEVRLRERIQSALVRQKSLSYTAKHVSVAVDKSDVTLEGDVRTAREKADVQAIVEKVQGVRRVHNKLGVINATMMPAPDALR